MLKLISGQVGHNKITTKQVLDFYISMYWTTLVLVAVETCDYFWRDKQFMFTMDEFSNTCVDYKKLYNLNVFVTVIVDNREKVIYIISIYLIPQRYYKLLSWMALPFVDNNKLLSTHNSYLICWINTIVCL